jgi:hypothetical protein
MRMNFFEYEAMELGWVMVSSSSRQNKLDGTNSREKADHISMVLEMLSVDRMRTQALTAGL